MDWRFILIILTLKIEERNFQCCLPQSLKNEINTYAPIVQQIIDIVTVGSFKGVTYDELGKFVRKFPSRTSGSEVLEKSIDYMKELSAKEKLENIHEESVEVPHWERGKESAMLLQPWRRKIKILGLGYSIGTPPEGITADALVVKSFKDLQNKKNLVKGKIIIFNQKWVGYKQTVAYRLNGASEAAKLGALATLIKSITIPSSHEPHTGKQVYQKLVPKIPSACITVQDALMFSKMQRAGTKITILLNMNATNLPNKISRNLITDLRGKENPENVVIISGHIDSWDVGQCAQDDGGGIFIAWAALAVLKRLNLRAKRSIRSTSATKLRSLNSILLHVPIELHLPGYNFCGAGTKLAERLKRGDKGINPLDEACKKHDVTYSKTKIFSELDKADKILEESAWERVMAIDATISESACAWIVTNLMKAKRALGGESKKKIAIDDAILKHLKKNPIDFNSKSQQLLKTFELLAKLLLFREI